MKKNDLTDQVYLLIKSNFMIMDDMMQRGVYDDITGIIISTLSFQQALIITLNERVKKLETMNSISNN